MRADDTSRACWISGMRLIVTVLWWVRWRRAPLRWICWWGGFGRKLPRLKSGCKRESLWWRYGRYGRRQLFPHSDVDLMFLLDAKVAEKDVKDAIRRVSQEMWDCGMRVSPMTRKLAECERFDPENAEFTLALLDQRQLTGDTAVHQAPAGGGAAEGWCRRSGRRL